MWRFDLHAAARWAHGNEVLDEQELRRAASFVFSSDRERFVTGRCLLRTILGKYLCIAPERVLLRESSEGKPALVDHDSLSFNVSHSKHVWYAAVLTGSEIGIDVELEHPVDNVFALADMVFSPSERQQLRECPANQVNETFLRGWTRKEAYVKALGVGIGIDLEAITTGLGMQGLIVPPIDSISAIPLIVHILHSGQDEHISIASSQPISDVLMYVPGTDYGRIL